LIEDDQLKKLSDNTQLVKLYFQRGKTSASLKITISEPIIIKMLSLNLAGVLEQRRCEQPPLPWSIQQQSTTLQSGNGAAVLTPISLIQPLTTPCEL